jgi:hypothetical protein
MCSINNCTMQGLSNQEVAQHVISGKRLQPTEQMQQVAGVVFERCLEYSPADRATFAEIVVLLNEALQNLSVLPPARSSCPQAPGVFSESSLTRVAPADTASPAAGELPSRYTVLNFQRRPEPHSMQFATETTSVV